MTDWRFQPTDPNCGLEQFIGEAVGAASMCWETPEGAGVFDSTRASAIVDAIYERANGEDGARLGMATTHTMLHELRARLRDNPDALTRLQGLRDTLSNEEFAYRTVD